MAFLVLFTTACSSNTESLSSGSQNTPCTNGGKKAVLQVIDGSMKRICGCNEGASDFIQTTALSCTVNQGTTLFIQYGRLTQARQVSIQGFFTFMIRDAATQPGISDAILLNQTGTFLLRDLRFPSNGATIIVN